MNFEGGSNCLIETKLAFFHELKRIDRANADIFVLAFSIADLPPTIVRFHPRFLFADQLLL
jgi:hypothetical protein